MTTVPERDPKLAGMEYTNSIHVKALFYVDHNEVKSYSDLIDFFTSRIEFIKQYERDGWIFEHEQSCDWIHFSHSDRNVVIEELGLESVLCEEQSFLEQIEEEEQAEAEAASKS